MVVGLGHGCWLCTSEGPGVRWGGAAGCHSHLRSTSSFVSVVSFPASGHSLHAFHVLSVLMEVPSTLVGWFYYGSG